MSTGSTRSRRFVGSRGAARLAAAGASAALAALGAITLGAIPALAVEERGATRATGTSAAQPADRDQARWKERIDAADRALLEAWIGHAPPEFPEDLDWKGGAGPTPLSWAALRGKVVVLQSWTSGSSAGRRALGDAESLRETTDPGDVVIVLLHTPEDADNLATFLERRPVALPIAVDSRGSFCDELAVYKRPVNVVVDRHGAVRWAALNERGVISAVAHLVEEPFDPERTPAARDEDASATPAKGAEFPAVTTPVTNAIDFRGRRAPEFAVGQWITERPNADGKVVILDFWATWCGPCVSAIPHMNELAERFRDDVVVVGVSSESRSQFDSGLARLAGRGVTPETFRYSLAVDSNSRMGKAIGVKSIPHCVVVDSTWIVRWQGHPQGLSGEVVEQIVAADRAQSGSKPGKAAGARKRWTKE